MTYKSDFERRYERLCKSEKELLSQNNKDLFGKVMLSNEEIEDIIEKAQITLKNYTSIMKQTEFARMIEAKIWEKNS